MEIKVVSTVPGKMLNFNNVTEITKSNGWIFVKRESEVIAILIETNVVAILQNTKEENTNDAKVQGFEGRR